MVPWIIGLCVTAALAIIGWTTTANLAARMRTFEQIRIEAVDVKANIMANNVRVSVLETKYDTIQAALVEIKTLLLGHMDKYHERS